VYRVHINCKAERTTAEPWTGRQQTNNTGCFSHCSSTSSSVDFQVETTGKTTRTWLQHRLLIIIIFKRFNSTVFKDEGTIHQSMNTHIEECDAVSYFRKIKYFPRLFLSLPFLFSSFFFPYLYFFIIYYYAFLVFSYLKE
jgi:hypothetical protein